MGHGETERDDTASVRPPLRLDVGEPPFAPDAVWTADETFSRAEPTGALLAFAAEHLQAQGLMAGEGGVLVRHRPGDRGLPAAVGPAGFGFALDLTDARRTLDGGLLLFVDATGRATGWRPERGALTIWSGADPELTELAPGAPDRLTLFGRADPA